MGALDSCACSTGRCEISSLMCSLSLLAEPGISRLNTRPRFATAGPVCSSCMRYSGEDIHPTAAAIEEALTGSTLLSFTL